MMFSELMIKIDHTLTEAINAIQDESGSGLSDVGRAVQEKFKGWRQEVDDVSVLYTSGTILGYGEERLRLVLICGINFWGCRCGKESRWLLSRGRKYRTGKMSVGFTLIDEMGLGLLVIGYRSISSFVYKT